MPWLLYSRVSPVSFIGLIQLEKVEKVYLPSLSWEAISARWSMMKSPSLEAFKKNWKYQNGLSSFSYRTSIAIQVTLTMAPRRRKRQSIKEVLREKKSFITFAKKDWWQLGLGTLVLVTNLTGILIITRNSFVNSLMASIHQQCKTSLPYELPTVASDIIT